MNPLIPGFGFIFIAAVAGGAFGLQYRVQRRYTVDNTALMSLFFATVVVPFIAINILLPGWTLAIARGNTSTLVTVYLLGFGWGLGAITYAFGFNLLGMALGAAMIKGMSVAVGTGIPLIRRWETVETEPKLFTILGILLLLAGTAISAKAGILREHEAAVGSPVSPASTPDPDPAPAWSSGLGAAGTASQTVASLQSRPADSVTVNSGREVSVFWRGMMWCAFSGVLSACANLGYDYAEPLQQAANGLGRLDLYGTLIRWMPMYWGGITALLIFMGGSMLRQGTWRNYFARGSLRDFLVASSMGVVHFLAQIPYGVGAFYLGKLGTTVGFGVNLGMALIVASALGFLTGEWRGASRSAIRTLCAGIGVLLVAMGVLAYANSLVQS
jgi:hypothetical protein